MPLYEYQCESCAHRFERIQKFSDPPVETCPQCGGAVRKLLSSPAIQFKGSGFYITDYGKGGSGGESKGEKADKAGAAGDAKADKPDKADKAGKADTKTDAKPAAKADSGGSKAG